MSHLDQQIQHAAALLRQASNVVAMTGAGISTPSGIPDFRSPNSGLWESSDPRQVASLYAFWRNPQIFYDWIHPLCTLLATAQPNPAHYALAALEAAGKLRAVITQNIDDLHGRAGSKLVFELHGHLREVTCMACRQSEAAQDFLAKFIADRQIPYHHCGGVLKPKVILFGETLPLAEYLAAEAASRQADLVLVAGSSLEVAPASELPLLALQNGAKVIIVNYEPTYLAPRAEVVIQADVAEVLPRLVELSLCP